jgi:hypothetical protein
MPLRSPSTALQNLDLGPLIAEIDPSFIPVDLSFLSPTVALRNERLPPLQTHLPFARPDMVAHRRFGHRGVGKLRKDAPIQPPSRVPLLARRNKVRRQNLVNEDGYCTELRLAPCWVTVPWRQRTGDSLANNATMNTELRGNSRDRANTKFMLPTELFEQIHFGFPVHKRPPDPTGVTVR